MNGMPDYDASVIEQFADKLYRKAASMVVGSVAVGAALGFAFGSVPFTSLASHWPIPHSVGFVTLIAGGAIGAMIGYVIGDARGFGYRLQAQAALCQLQTERNTASAARTIAWLAAVTNAAAARQAGPPPAEGDPRLDGSAAGEPAADETAASSISWEARAAR